MPLSRAAIDELKAIHRQETGEDLTDDQAWTMGRRLLRTYAFLLRSETPSEESPKGFEPRPT